MGGEIIFYVLLLAAFLAGQWRYERLLQKERSHRMKRERELRQDILGQEIPAEQVMYKVPDHLTHGTMKLHPYINLHDALTAGLMEAQITFDREAPTRSRVVVRKRPKARIRLGEKDKPKPRFGVSVTDYPEYREAQAQKTKEMRRLLNRFENAEDAALAALDSILKDLDSGEVPPDEIEDLSLTVHRSHCDKGGDCGGECEPLVLPWFALKSIRRPDLERLVRDFVRLH